MPDDIARFVGREKNGQLADISRAAYKSRRNHSPRGSHVEFIAEHNPVAFDKDPAGRDRVHTDTLLNQLESDLPCEGDDRALRTRVHRMLGHAGEGVNGSEIDHGAASLFNRAGPEVSRGFN